MEIVKQNESFNVKDTNGTFEMNGSVSRDVSGSLNLHFNVSRVGGEHVGDCHYKYKVVAILQQLIYKYHHF